MKAVAAMWGEEGGSAARWAWGSVPALQVGRQRLPLRQWGRQAGQAQPDHHFTCHFCPLQVVSSQHQRN